MGMIYLLLSIFRTDPFSIPFPKSSLKSKRRAPVTSKEIFSDPSAFSPFSPEEGASSPRPFSLGCCACSIQGSHFQKQQKRAYARILLKKEKPKQREGKEGTNRHHEFGVGLNGGHWGEILARGGGSLLALVRIALEGVPVSWLRQWEQVD